MSTTDRIGRGRELATVVHAWASSVPFSPPNDTITSPPAARIAAMPFVIALIHVWSRAPPFHAALQVLPFASMNASVRYFVLPAAATVPRSCRWSVSMYGANE